MKNEMVRYSVIRDKNPREIVLLRGNGCKWRRCTFCDYHLDFSTDPEANFVLNRKVLSHVTGIYHQLEVINSGSFCDLDEKTMAEIEAVCRSKNITQLHFESHFMHREAVPALRKRFAALGIQVKVKIGVETFDRELRENLLCKGICVSEPERIAEYFDEACLLFGISGQTADSMKHDIETGLSHFERVCVNLMTQNTTAISPDPNVIREFQEAVYPFYRENPRVDVLLCNTDFGVGGDSDAE